MKTLAALAALVLAVPVDSFARGKVIVTTRPVVVSRVVVPRLVPTVRYVRPHYHYSSSYYAPSYYGGYYPYGYAYGGIGPSISFNYSSAPVSRPVPAPAYNTDSRTSLEADVQRELRRQGYYDGSIDGDIGPASRAAIREYQSVHRLAPTGRIDASLLRSLGL